MMNKVMGAEALYFVGLAPSRTPAWPLTLGVVAFVEEFDAVVAASTALMTVLRTASVRVEAILSKTVQGLPLAVWMRMWSAKTKATETCVPEGMLLSVVSMQRFGYCI